MSLSATLITQKRSPGIRQCQLFWSFLNHYWTFPKQACPLNYLFRRNNQDNGYQNIVNMIRLASFTEYRIPQVSICLDTPLPHTHTRLTFVDFFMLF